MSKQRTPGSLHLLSERARSLLHREDFRRNPVKAVYRRFAWRLRWKLYPNRPWLIRAQSGLPLLTPKCSAGALIYYQGVSEPETAEFIRRVLRPGEVFVDIGAHLGEYAILASMLVKPAGCVHAFEPRPDFFQSLETNLRLNKCENVWACAEAVCKETGVADFELDPEPSKSALQFKNTEARGHEVIQVRTITLDYYFSHGDMARPNLIKIDVEGAELSVLQGARSLLAKPPSEAPLIIFEYEPRNTRRFGYPAEEIIRFLRGYGYSVYDSRDGALVPTDKYPMLDSRGFGRNLIATKMSSRIGREGAR